MGFSSSVTRSTDTFSISDSRCLRRASSWETRSWASTTCFSCESFARASCKPCERDQWFVPWGNHHILRTKYTVDPSKTIGIIPGIISLHHSECFEFPDAAFWLYARPVPAPRRLRLTLSPSRLQIISFNEWKRPPEVLCGGFSESRRWKRRRSDDRLIELSEVTPDRAHRNSTFVGHEVELEV